jgi:Zn-dependent peptidase ImmA (M78 family)
LAHELGHLATGAMYSLGADHETVKKRERAAERWAVNALVPYTELLKVLNMGVEDIAGLAERFSVTEEFMEKVIRFYRAKEGVYD